MARPSKKDARRHVVSFALTDSEVATLRRYSEWPSLGIAAREVLLRALALPLPETREYELVRSYQRLPPLPPRR